MNELDNGGQLMVMLAFILEGIRNQQDQYRAYAFAASTDNVFGDLVDQGNFRMQFVADYLIHFVHIDGYQFSDGVLVVGGRQGRTCLRIRDGRDYTMQCWYLLELHQFSYASSIYHYAIACLPWVC